MWGCGVFLRTMIAMMGNDLNDGLWFELGEKEEVGGKEGWWLFGVVGWVALLVVGGCHSRLSAPVALTLALSR